jgi:hypothetical protein
VHKLTYIFESNLHLVFATFLNEKKKSVRASNPHLSFNRPLPTGRLNNIGCLVCLFIVSIIVRSFKKCCTSNALDGPEDDILWEDDGEDKDDSDWVTDNDSVTSDEGESGE